VFSVLSEREYFSLGNGNQNGPPVTNSRREPEGSAEY